MYGLIIESILSLVLQLTEKNKIKHLFSSDSDRAGKDWLRGFRKTAPCHYSDTMGNSMLKRAVMEPILQESPQTDNKSLQSHFPIITAIDTMQLSVELIENNLINTVFSVLPLLPLEQADNIELETKPFTSSTRDEMNITKLPGQTASR